MKETKDINNWSALRDVGGVRGLERIALGEFRSALKRDIRERWLASLIAWELGWHQRLGNNKPDRRDRNELAYIHMEIGRLRRLLGIPPTIEETRRRTRERVRRWRERKRKELT